MSLELTILFSFITSSEIYKNIKPVHADTTMRGK